MLKSLPADIFLKWLNDEIGKILLNHLQQASRVQKVLEKLLLSMKNTNNNPESISDSFEDSETIAHLCSNIKNSYCDEVLSDNKTILFRFCEATQKEISRILQIRVEQHSKMQLNDFVSVYNFVNQFIEETEKFCNRQCLSLRGTLASQVIISFSI